MFGQMGQHAAEVPARHGSAIGDMGLAVLKVVGMLLLIIAKHPVPATVLAGMGAVGYLVGPMYVAAGLAVVMTVLVAWWVLDRATFNRVLSEPARRALRRHWRYQRPWARVMRGCGLTMTHGASERVPKLGRLEQGEYADRVTVQLLPGQHVGDWEKRVDALAAGFDAIECRVQQDHHKREGRVRTGRVVLVFKTGEALADVVPAMPIFDEAPEAVMPKERSR